MSIEVGKRVSDKDSEDSNAVVVRSTNVPAMDYSVPSQDGKTVAELNPDYSPMSEVIEVVFEESLEREIPKWAFLDEEALQKIVDTHKMDTYMYPEDRLDSIDEALVDGIVLRVSGVADPIDGQSGAYTYVVEKEKNETVHRNERRFDTDELQLNHIDTTTSTYAGIVDGLEWIAESRPSTGVLIRTENEKVFKQVRGDYEVRNESDRKLFERFQQLSDRLPHVSYQLVDREYNSELHAESVELFKSDSQSDSNVDIQQVVGDEYIVDGVFAVNTSQETCTCEKVGHCEHIEAVEKEA